MKSKLLFVTTLLLVALIAFSACNKKDETPDNGSGGGNGNSGDSTGVSEGYIYKSGTALGLRCDFEFYKSNELETLSGNLYTNTELKHLGLNDDQMEHEIVIGRSDLPISIKAYEKLSTLRLNEEQENDPEAYTKWLIYSDGKSVAIVFDEHIDFISFKVAAKYFIDNLILDSLSLKEGVVSSGVISIYDYYKVEDEARFELLWRTLEEHLGENGNDIVSALQNLYTLYDEKLVSWIANLYEPDICICEGDTCLDTPFCGTSAFYYSNSARDTQGFLPDVESTRQALSILESSGIVSDYATDLPAEMIADMVNFVRALQDESGYFYHPQWGTMVNSSRRNRDLSSAVGILKRAGASPVYDTPNGIKGDGVIPSSVSLTGEFGKSAVVAVSSVIATAVTDSNLKDKESFIDYLNRLDVRNNAYAAGNTLAAYCTVIKERDKELAAEGADYKLFDIMIDHLNANQNPDDGSWYWVDVNDPGYSLYTAVNGIMKITCVYETAWKPMPNCDKALKTAMDAIISSTAVGACVDIYNTWFAIHNIFAILSHVGGADGAKQVEDTRAYLRANAPALIEASREKLNTFTKLDGSFSYHPKYSSYQSQGVLAAVPQSVEGDMNGTAICTTGTVALIYSCLGIDMVPFYGKADYYSFIKEISELQRVIKDELDTTVTLGDGVNHSTGKYTDSALDFEKGTATKLAEAGRLHTDQPDQMSYDVVGAQNNVSIVDVEWNGGTTKALSFKKTANGDPYLYICPEKAEAKSYVFETDICLLGGSTSFSDGAVLTFFFVSDSGAFYDSIALYKTGLYDKDMNLIYNVGVEDTNISSAGWHNIRVEMQDISKQGSDIRFYLDGTLIQRKKSTKAASTLADVALRFRYDSGLQSSVVLDNLYFSSVENLENDNTPLIPPVDIIEIGGGLNVNSDNRGTGVYYDKAIKYTDTNATLLDIAGLIATSGLTYDVKNTASKVYANVVSLKGDAALEMGKYNNNVDPYLMIPETEKRDGKGYVFETDILFITGTDKRTEDDVVLEAFWAKGSSTGIFWNGQMNLSEVDGDYTFNMGLANAEGKGLSLPVEKLRWYNLRMEFDDVSKVGSQLRVYVDGALVHTAILTKSIDSLTHFIIRYKLATNNGRLLLDNTYFAATGELRPDTPAEPDVPDTPAGPEYSGTRGEGAYKNNENTLDFAGISGIITANGGATLDGADIFAKVEKVDGDNALVLGNNQWSKEGYINIKSNGLGTKYIFETDLMLDSSVIAPGSGRDGNVMFSFYTGNGESSNNWLWASINLCYVGGKYVIKIADSTKTLQSGGWINLRVEIDDTSTIGSEVRYYLGGELFATYNLTKSCTDFSHVRIWMPPSTKGTLTLDNLCFITLNPWTDGGDDNTEEPGEQPGENPGEQPGGGNEGGDTEVTNNRGSGAYADNENTLTYTDTTATELGESGKLVVSGKGTIDGTDMSASVVEIDGDAALKLSNNQHKQEAYFNVRAAALGTKYVFETDLMFASGSSSRSDKTFLTFYCSNASDASSTHWMGMPSASLVATGNGGYKLACGGKEVVIKAGEWFNVRYEFENTGTTGNEIRFYVNGELLHTATNSKTTTGLHFIRIFTPADSQGEIYLDNTYYAAIDAVIPETPTEPDVPETPEQPGEQPGGGNEGGDDNEGGDNTEGGDTEVTNNRGSGTYANNENTLTYTDTTATELGESGKLVVTGKGTLDGTDMSASVVEIDGDAALKLSNNQHKQEAYFNVRAAALGTKYVFETDLMFASGSSSRSDKTFLTFYCSNASDASSTHWMGMPSASLVATGNGGYKLACGGKEVVIKAGEWFNVRYEFENTGTTGNEIRFYVNGELLHTATNSKTTTGLHFIRVFTPADSQGEIYLDNTYYSAINN